MAIKRNMRCLFGQEFDTPDGLRKLLASTSTNTSIGVDKSACNPHVGAKHQGGSKVRGRATSDTGVHSEGWRPDGSRWAKSASDSVLTMKADDMKKLSEDKRAATGHPTASLRCVVVDG